jgi:PhzF family phenazine biosynthesis protein
MPIRPRVPIVTVDAFSSAPFAGNPAAVCVLDAERDETWMQRIAAEMNLAATSFLQPHEGGYALRWFTPSIEVNLCGHGTLASAHVLWESGRVPLNERAHFHTRSGVLKAERDGEWIQLNLPAKPEEPAEPPLQLLQGLGVTSVNYIGRNQFDYIVELESEEALRSVQPDHTALRKLPVRGVIITSRSAADSGDNQAYDFVSRFFAPGSGIDEDPVTGSAHCALAPYWSKKLGKTELRAFQASPRGGFLKLRVEGDRVRLSGQAVTIMQGELLA